MLGKCVNFVDGFLSNQYALNLLLASFVFLFLFYYVFGFSPLCQFFIIYIPNAWTTWTASTAIVSQWLLWLWRECLAFLGCGISHVINVSLLLQANTNQWGGTIQIVHVYGVYSAISRVFHIRAAIVPSIVNQYGLHPWEYLFFIRHFLPV